jgi:hypothetical protein
MSEDEDNRSAPQGRQEARSDQLARRSARAGADAAGGAGVPQLHRQAVLHPLASMMPNLLVGDRLVVSKYPYGWSGSRPASTCCRATLADRCPHARIWRHRHRRAARPREDYIKRVVALPGDRIAVVERPDRPQRQAGAAGRSNRRCACRSKPNQLRDLRPPHLPAVFEPYRVRLPDGREVCEPPTARDPAQRRELPDHRPPRAGRSTTSTRSPCRRAMSS